MPTKGGPCQQVGNARIRGLQLAKGVNDFASMKNKLGGKHT